MATIESLLNSADLPDSPTPRLDAELLLAAALNKPRSYLRTWPERELDGEQLALFQSNLQRRRQGEPVAYILGHQGFWSLDLEVAPHTLIPRPDTELLVETALELLPATPLAVLDLGTGTGAIALALASERPAWQVTGVDRVEDAVALAERNRQRLQLDNVNVFTSHWFSATARARPMKVNTPNSSQRSRARRAGNCRAQAQAATTSTTSTKVKRDSFSQKARARPDTLRAFLQRRGPWSLISSPPSTAPSTSWSSVCWTRHR